MHATDEPDQEEPTRIGERGRRGGQDPEGDGAGGADHAQQPAEDPPRGALRPPQLALGQAAHLVAPLGEQHETDGERAADEEALRAGVGPEVGPVGVEAAVVHDVHPDGRRDGGRAAQREQCPQAPGEVHDGEHHERPDHVELLLHRQRPRVQQRRGRRRLVEVVRVDEDEVPVAHVEERRQRVEAQCPVRPLGHDDGGEEGHEEQHQEEGGQQAAGPAGPERPELDRQRLAPLADEQRGDEEAREDEERVHAHEPAVHVRDPAVEQHHGRDGAGPHPVERREVGETSVRRRALVVLHGAHPSSVGSGRHRTLGGRRPVIVAERARDLGAGRAHYPVAP